MSPSRPEDWLRVWAPAKINLFLELKSRRTDGYHELETVMAAINVFDHLAAQPTEEPQIQFHCRWTNGMGRAPNEPMLGDLPTDDRNIAFRAVRLLQQRASVQRGLRLCLTKRVPSQAGLGGASSNAACALLLANRVWGLNWSRPALAELAAEIGSDVPFFVYGTPSICRGRGERMEPFATKLRLPLVVVKPPVGLSTPAVFSQAQVPIRPSSCASLVAGMTGGDLSAVAGSLFNRLQSAASLLSPWIQYLHSLFDRYSVLGHAMSGSGSGYFAICRSMRHAENLAHAIRSQGLAWTMAVSTFANAPSSLASL